MIPEFIVETGDIDKIGPKSSCCVFFGARFFFYRKILPVDVVVDFDIFTG
jgi:hypothetical protein